MTIEALALTAITAVLLLLGAWIGICIDDNRRADNRERAHVRLSEQFVDELNLISSHYYGRAAGPDLLLRSGCGSVSADARRGTPV